MPARDRSVLCQQVLVFVIFLVFITGRAFAQCDVSSGTSAVYNINFSAAKDTSWTLSASRSGTACVGTTSADTRCIRFNITVNPGTDLINFTTKKITGASFYSINCEKLIPIGEPACIKGLTTICISFCKPGNDPDDYVITASTIIKGSSDLILRQNCSGTMSVTGVSASTVNWRSVFPGSSGTYNNYLSATSGVSSVTVTPQTGAPTYIDYEVSGTGTCTGLSRDTIRVYTVSPMTVAINPASPTICNGTSVALTSTVSGGNPPYTYSWNTGPTTSGLTVSTPATYTLTVRDNTNNCPAVAQPVTVNAAASPAAPTAAGTTICSGNTATLNASAPGGIYQWFASASGGTALATGASYTTPVLTATTTYYVQTTVNGCTSTRTAVTVTVNPVPAAPTVAGVSICAGNTATLQATAPGGTYQWFNVASGGTALSSGPSYTTPVLNSTTQYYVQSSNGTCAGPRTAVTVTVNPVPANPTVVGATICSGNTANVSAIAPGGSYQWYDASSGGNFIGSGTSYTTPTLSSTTTYYAQTTVNGCTSTGRSAATVTVQATPAAPSVTTASICEGQSTTLTASGSVGNFKWYTAASGGSLLYAGNSYITPTLTANTTYYVNSTSAEGCIGPRTATTVTVTAVANPSFIYSSGTYCRSGSNPTPTIPGGATGTFTASPAGLVFANASTGTINVAASTAGRYTITFSISGSCTFSSSASISITENVVDAAFAYPSNYCVKQTNPLPVFTGIASAGTFSSTTGLVFQNAQTGEINLNASQPGTYTVTNTITAAPGCQGDTKTNTVVIEPGPTANANVDQVVCERGTVTLNGQIGGVATSGVWSIVSGAGTLSNSNALNSTFTPASGQSLVTLRLTSNDPTGPCNAISDDMIVEIKAAPALPTVSTQGVCAGNAATLTATAPGGTYKWYSSASGGTPEFTGASFITPVLNANSNYYVSATSIADGCESERREVTAIVNARPVINSASTGSVCSQQSFSYTLNSTIAGTTYTWGRAAVTGINNAVVSGQTSQVISETLNNQTTSPIAVTYQIVPEVNGCSGNSFDYVVTVQPIPATPSASNNGPVCEASALNLSTAELSGAGYLWSGPAGFSSTDRTPVVSNMSNTNAGSYSVRVVVNGCQSLPGSTSVSVKPRPAIPQASNSSPVCNGETVTLSAPIILGATYQWTGPNGYAMNARTASITNATPSLEGRYALTVTVDGCTSLPGTTDIVVNTVPTEFNVFANGPICENEALRLLADSIRSASYNWYGPGGFFSNIRETIVQRVQLQNAGTYQVAVTLPGCPGLSSNVDVAIKSQPAAPVVSGPPSVCEFSSLQLTASATTGATFSWQGPLNFTSTQNGIRIDSIQMNRAGTYQVTSVVNGCISTPTSLNIQVRPKPAAPQLSNNGPVCVGDTIRLNASSVVGGGYFWFRNGTQLTTQQNLIIPAVTLNNAGRYVSQVSVNGCLSDSVFTSIQVDEPPQSFAGNNVSVCANNAAVNLSGLISGGTNTGVWSSDGTGRFLRSTSLNTTYFPSVSDTGRGIIRLSLTSTNNGACRAAVSSLLVTITDAPWADAGADRLLCMNDSAVTLNGVVVRAGGGIWSSTGSGVFVPSNTDLNAVYRPSASDLRSNNFRITLTTTNNGNCLAVQDQRVIQLTDTTKVEIGKDLFVFENNPIRINPTINGNAVAYAWSPPQQLNNPNVKDPVFRGPSDERLYVRVTSDQGCVSRDDVFITVVKPFKIPNVFSPNGDGIHDTWVIPELERYPDAIVSVFDRYGRRIFFTVGYTKPWNGTHEGKPVAVATYYYIIEPKLIPGIFSGSVTILK